MYPNRTITITKAKKLMMRMKMKKRMMTRMMKRKRDYKIRS